MVRAGMGKYDELNKDELVRLLEARDRREATRFGLVWEAGAEKETGLNTDYVALDLVPDGGEVLVSKAVRDTLSASASCAAASRFGETSVARMDCDTSITNMTTARLRGIRTSFVGPAIATVSSNSDATNRIAGRCRHRVGRLGATLSSNSMFAKRSIRR